MARSEENREDLLRDATAFVERVELLIPQSEEPIFVGFRKDGAASFFFGQHRVCHFNAAGEMRRAYLGGLLYKADGGQLSVLQRERSADVTVLLRRELSAAEQAEILADLERELHGLTEAMLEGNFTIAGQVPNDWPVAGRLSRWLAAHSDALTIASRPGLS